MAISLTLESTAYTLDQLTARHEAQIALAGRSNVGKSSLVNALAGRKKLAKVSSTPGKTRSVNFYLVEPLNFYLVDLPGYGYAKVSAAEKEKWGKMIEGYLHNSKELRAVFLLVDIRHKPSANDKQMYDWICHNGYEPVIIATKLDKLKRSQVAKSLKEIRIGLGLPKEGKILPFSAETKQGRDEIWALIDELTGLGEPAATED